MAPNGKPIHYSHTSERLMACWSGEEWSSRINNIVSGAVGAGAAGIVLDSVCFGAAPLLIEKKFEGPAGCHCRRCQDKFRADTGKSGAATNSIPRRVAPDD